MHMQAGNEFIVWRWWEQAFSPSSFSLMAKTIPTGKSIAVVVIFIDGGGGGGVDIGDIVVMLLLH